MKTKKSNPALRNSAPSKVENEKTKKIEENIREHQSLQTENPKPKPLIFANPNIYIYIYIYIIDEPGQCIRVCNKKRIQKALLEGCSVLQNLHSHHGKGKYVGAD